METPGFLISKTKLSTFRILVFEHNKFSGNLVKIQFKCSHKNSELSGIQTKLNLKCSYC